MTERIYYSQEAAERARRTQAVIAAMAFAAGAGVGAVIALLLAPSSGESIRQELSSTIEDGYDSSRRAIEDTLKDAKQRVS